MKNTSALSQGNLLENLLKLNLQALRQIIQLRRLNRGTVTTLFPGESLLLQERFEGIVEGAVMAIWKPLARGRSRWWNNSDHRKLSNKIAECTLC